MEGGGEHFTGMAAPKTKVWGLKCLKKKKKKFVDRYAKTSNDWGRMALVSLIILMLFHEKLP